MSDEKKSRNILLTLQKYKILVIIIAIVVAALAVYLGLSSRSTTQQTTTKLGFEDIGELATQSAYTTQVASIEKSRTLFGKDIPLTGSHYIYSYDVVIKAGINFSQVAYSVDDEQKTIQISLPEAEIFSCEVKNDSLKVYLEDESVFRDITMEELNETDADMKQQAQDTAVENGLLDNATENAKTILSSFFAQAYNLDEYQVIYA
jgi:hypothetical protein